MGSSLMAYSKLAQGLLTVTQSHHSLGAPRIRLSHPGTRFSSSVGVQPHHQRSCIKVSVALDDNQATTSGREDDLSALTEEYITHLQQEFTIGDLVTFSAGPGGLPIVTLKHPNGSSAQIFLHGGTISNWTRADGRELLHLRDDNPYNGQDPVRGGIEVAWPQHGAGLLPTHGLLRTLHWSVLETAAATEDLDNPRPTVMLYACTEPSTEDVWPHSFEAVYTVSLLDVPYQEPNPKQLAQEFDETLGDLWEDAIAAEVPEERIKRAMAARKKLEEEKVVEPPPPVPATTKRTRSRAAMNKAIPDAPDLPDAVDDLLDEGGIELNEDDDTSTVPPTALYCRLAIHNTDDKDMSFTAGLRQHYAIEDLTTHDKYVKVLGLGGKYLLDYTKDEMRPRMGVEGSDFVFFDKDKDQVKVYTDAGQEGQVLFCPGTRSHFDIKNQEGFADIAIEHPGKSRPEYAAKHVCVTSAKKAVPVRLAPGDMWAGEATITQYDNYWPLPPFERDDPSTMPLPPRTTALPPKRGDSDGDLSALLD